MGQRYIRNIFRSVTCVTLNKTKLKKAKVKNRVLNFEIIIVGLIVIGIKGVYLGNKVQSEWSIYNFISCTTFY